MCMTSNIPTSIVMAITSRYPKLRYIRNAEMFCREFLKMSYKAFLSEETLERLSAVASGCSWEQAAVVDEMPTMAEVIAAFSKMAV